jgi:hypothetical protein
MSDNKSDNSQGYLSNRALRALQNSLALISDVLHFQIVQLWIKDNDELNCLYSFVATDSLPLYPQITSGYRADVSASPKLVKKVNNLFL